MTTAKAIMGKVAKVLNARELAINRGVDDGVQLGMRFQVLEPEVVIEDPDTKEQLGLLQRGKIKVKVVEAHAKYSVAQTYETYRTDPVSLAIESALGRVTEVKRLYGERPPGLPKVDIGGASVSVGDSVVQLTEEESSSPR
jgi:hypothetical protein